jgi:hypothetical protein
VKRRANGSTQIAFPGPFSVSMARIAAMPFAVVLVCVLFISSSAGASLRRVNNAKWPESSVDK